MICRLIKKGLRNGHNQKGGGGNSKKGALGAGQVKSPPPTYNVGSGTTEKYGTWTLLSSSYL